jgi:hypothetical protein
MFTVAVVEQPLKSVTVMVYAPAVMLVPVEPDPPVGVQE